MAPRKSYQDVKKRKRTTIEEDGDEQDNVRRMQELTLALKQVHRHSKRRERSLLQRIKQQEREAKRDRQIIAQLVADQNARSTSEQVWQLQLPIRESSKELSDDSSDSSALRLPVSARETPQPVDEFVRATPEKVLQLRQDLARADTWANEAEDKLWRVKHNYPEAYARLEEHYIRLKFERPRSQWARAVLLLCQRYISLVSSKPNSVDPLAWRPETIRGFLPSLTAVLTTEPAQGHNSWATDEILRHMLTEAAGRELRPEWYLIIDPSLAQLYANPQYSTEVVELQYAKQLATAAAEAEEGLLDNLFAKDIPAQCTNAATLYNQDGVHWITLTFSVKHGKGVILIFDSLKDRSATIPQRVLIDAQHLARCLSVNTESAFYGATFELDNIEYATCPQQANQEDCGFLAADTAILLAQGAALPTPQTLPQKRLHAERIRWRVAEGIATKLGINLGNFADSRAVSTTLPGIPMLSTDPEWGILSELLDSQPLDQLSPACNFGVLIVEHLSRAGIASTKSLLNTVTDRMLAWMQRSDINPRTFLIGFLQSSAQFEKAPEQPYQASLQYSKDPDLWTTWRLSGAVFPYDLALLQMLHASSSQSSADSLVEPADLLLCVVRTSRPFVSLKVADMHRVRPAELQEGYYARFSRFPQQREEVLTFEDFSTAARNGLKSWMRVSLEPTSSTSRFLLANTEINQQVKLILSKLNLQSSTQARRVQVVLVSTGYDGISTNHGTWTWLRDTYPNLDFRLTVATRQWSIGHASYGRQDGALPTVWHHLAVDKLCALLEPQSLARSTLPASASDQHHMQFLVYSSIIEGKKVVNAVIERFFGNIDKSFTTEFEVTANTIAGSWTRKGVELPTATDRRCIKCDRQDSELRRCGSAACDLACSECWTKLDDTIMTPAELVADEIPVHLPGQMLGSTSTSIGTAPTGAPDTGLYWCPICFVTIPVADHMEHVYKHCRETTSLCPVPGCLWVPTRGTLFNRYTHVVTHEMPGYSRPKFTCPICLQEYRQKGQLTEHMGKHGEQFLCNDSECENVPFSKQHLEGHRADVHPEKYNKHKESEKDYKFVCPHLSCRRRCKTKASLTSHIAKGHKKKKLQQQQSAVMELPQQQQQQPPPAAVKLPQSKTLKPDAAAYAQPKKQKSSGAGKTQTKLAWKKQQTLPEDKLCEE